jgi:hypothetical protein
MLTAKEVKFTQSNFLLGLIRTVSLLSCLLCSQNLKQLNFSSVTPGNFYSTLDLNLEFTSSFIFKVQSTVLNL